jgi:hypothetical protein
LIFFQHRTTHIYCLNDQINGCLVWNATAPSTFSWQSLHESNIFTHHTLLWTRCQVLRRVSLILIFQIFQNFESHRHQFSSKAVTIVHCRRFTIPRTTQWTYALYTNRTVRNSMVLHGSIQCMRTKLLCTEKLWVCTRPKPTTLLQVDHPATCHRRGPKHAVAVQRPPLVHT